MNSYTSSGYGGTTQQPGELLKYIPNYSPDLSKTPIKVDDESCNVYISESKIQNEIVLNVECKKTGMITLEIFNLLGNIVMQKKVFKRNYLLALPLDCNFQSGVYFIRMNIENNLLYYNKINIIK